VRYHEGDVVIIASTGFNSVLNGHLAEIAGSIVNEQGHRFCSIYLLALGNRSKPYLMAESELRPASAIDRLAQLDPG